MGKWTQLNLWAARIIALSTIIGLYIAYFYIHNNINPKFIGFTTIWGIWTIGVYLSAIIILLNIILTIYVNTHKHNKLIFRKISNNK